MRSEPATRRYRAAPGYDTVIREIEVRHCEDDDGIDEIVVKNALHLEMLDQDAAYLDIGGLRFNIQARLMQGGSQLIVTCEPDSDTPLI